MSTKIEKDSVTGTETTGHEWDGIKELNTPLPKLWIQTLWATVLASIVYIILYPAFPGWDGVLDRTNRRDVAQELATFREGRAEWLDKLVATPIEEIANDSDLLEFAVAGGRAVFADNCAPCHGAGAGGAKGYPNLLDDSWIWGGAIGDIETTITHGVRWSLDDDTRLSGMPRFGVDEMLTGAQIGDVAEYVLSLSGGAGDKAAAERGKEIFAENCVACHGETGAGNREFGAPRLSDALWLYGGDRETVVQSVTSGRGGVMPAWTGRLDEVTIKQLAVYVHSLGGGE